MPRGKNYVNNNRGVSFQASKKKKASQMVACQYGAGCTRKGCIYRHPDRPKASPVNTTSQKKSQEPCMPFLAGMCTFTDGGCRKRHPSKAEADRLVAKYSSTPCRYGAACRTRGCLYIHPDNEENEVFAGAEEKEMFTSPARSTMYSPTLNQCTPTPTYASQTPAETNIDHEYYAPQAPQSLYDQSSEASYQQTASWDPSNEMQPMEDGYHYDAQMSSDSYVSTTNTTYSDNTPALKAQELAFNSMNDELLMGHDVNGTNVHAKEFVPGNWS